jgi:hypothetical protein
MSGKAEVRIFHMEKWKKPVNIACQPAFRSFGDPFGSPIPQRPQPLDLLLRVGKSIHKNGRPGNPLSSNISFCKLCDQPVDRMIDQSLFGHYSSILGIT